MITQEIAPPINSARLVLVKGSGGTGEVPENIEEVS